MGGRNQNLNEARFQYKDELLAFNRREKNILALVDPEDPIVQQRSQGAWNKALNGKPSPDELVDALEALFNQQCKDPLPYIPSAPPEELQAWMDEIASRPWWAETLGIESGKISGWFAGRSKKIEVTIREGVQKWYDQLHEVASQTSKITRLGETIGDKVVFLERMMRLREDGEEITNDLLKSMVAAWHIAPRIIDWAEPKLGFGDVQFDDTRVAHRLIFDDLRGWLKEANANGWEGVRSSFPPDGVWDYEKSKSDTWPGKWADQYGLNKDLYGKAYRAEYRLVWNRDRRAYEMQDWRVVEVEGRVPTEREAAGWDEGSEIFFNELRKEREESFYT